MFVTQDYQDSHADVSGIFKETLVRGRNGTMRVCGGAKVDVRVFWQHLFN